MADPIRRDMLTRLSRGEATAGQLGAPFAISQPAASKHIRMLERAGLVSRHVDGRVHRLRLVRKPLHDAEAWIARHRRGEAMTGTRRLPHLSLRRTYSAPPDTVFRASTAIRAGVREPQAAVRLTRDGRRPAP